MDMSELFIRPAKPRDAAALLRIYAPYVTDTAITFEYEVPSEEAFRGRILRTLERYPWLVAELEGRAVGYAYAGPFKERTAYDWAVETTVYVARDARRGGVGRALYGALEAALGLMGVRNLYACIAFPAAEDPFLTDDSVRFHERMGYALAGRFQRCGCKFGRWYDMVWMEKMIGGHEENPSNVRPFPGIGD